MTNEHEYWTDEVEEAVSKYASCTDVDEKNKIYMKYLHDAFIKLIDDVIKRYRPDREEYEDKDVKNDLLYTLIIGIQRYNPALALSRGYKPNARIYCSVIIRCAIADYRVKSFREKQNVQFNEKIHEIFLKDIN
jgi:hypothetical protein